VELYLIDPSVELVKFLGIMDLHFVIRQLEIEPTKMLSSGIHIRHVLSRRK